LRKELEKRPSLQVRRAIDKLLVELSRLPREELQRRAESFLAARLRQVPPLRPERLQELVKRLDADSYRERQRAEKELRGLGRSAEAALQKALENKPSLQARRTMQRLLDELTAQPKQERQVQRAIEVLEYWNSPAARRQLEELSRGASGALVTEEARQALARLRPR
jgi:hypothetical protein